MAAQRGQSLKFSGAAGGKIEPGLSSFAASPKDAAEYMLPLLAKASELVPRERHPATKVLIKSTAGMRLLPLEVQEAIYDEVHAALVGNPLFPFAVDRGDVGTLDGDMEAFYAVLSANFLAGRIDALMHPTGHASGEIGALDMGGASTQIIFRHKAAGRPEHADEDEAAENDARNDRPCYHQQPSAAVANYDGNTNTTTTTTTTCSPRGSSSVVPTRDRNGTCTVPEGEGGCADGEGGRGPVDTVPVSRADFWGASHLGYGVAEVRLRMWDLLVETPPVPEGDEHGDVVNPCSFVGRVDEWKGRPLIGSGDHVVCEKIVAEVLWGRGGDEEEEKRGLCGMAADQPPCGIGGVSMPALNGDFLAMSVFFYAMHCLHALGPAELAAWPRPTLFELRDAARGFCGMEWRALQSRKDAVSAQDVLFSTSEEGLPHRCVEVVYMTTLLRDGYGFPEHSRNVAYALEAGGMEREIKEEAAAAAAAAFAAPERKGRPHNVPSAEAVVAFVVSFAGRFSGGSFFVY
ncbi:conserved unknown protein [Ectocarpus siliculosus]|uniref:Uncharacterized protein n=1 Tax=Ectocarpus siliculosus TaxID=2880 RepID=D7FJZ4_ECTSI|nr:conserved unknown protein [Ectocarpus siliculosus]|eukprot:CBJ49083.1 conserved unknown protein [Ectocarpus siliculosus]